MNLIKNRIMAGVLIASVFLVAVTLAGCGGTEASHQADDQKAEAAPTAPETFALHKGKISPSIQIPGELVAFQQVDLYAKVNSYVKQLYVDVGSEVKAGQLLAILDAPELNAQLAGAESRLQSQEAIYLASKANYDRLYETSQTPGTVSQNDIDQALAKKNSDQAQLNAAKSAYKEIADTKAYLEIRAPFEAVVSARNVSAGAYIGPSGKGSDLPIFTLQEQKKLRLVISVPELYTGYFSSKTNVSFTVKSRPNQKFSATVKRLAGALDSRFRAERIEMDVTNNNKALLPGMVAEVTIPLPATDSSFVIPSTALVNSTERVFIIKAVDGKAVWVDVKKGREEAGKFEIYGDLAEGDRILKVGSEEIRDGSKLPGGK